MTSLIKPQHDASFFKCPSEIRRLIYSYLFSSSRFHIRLQNGRPCLSPCVTFDDDRTDLDGTERKSAPAGGDWRDPQPDIVWSRRLRSTWGRHWRCEEVVIGEKETGNEDEKEKGTAKDRCVWGEAGTLPLNLMATCKQWCMDFVDVLMDIGTFYVTDLETLGYLMGKSVVSKEQDEKWDYMIPAMTNVEDLHILLRLPPAVMRSLENSGLGAEISDRNEDAKIWRALPDWIESMRYLERVEICLDHDNTMPWELADERRLFAPLASRERLSHIESKLTLPEIYHRYQNPEVHFTHSEQEEGLPFSVLRQPRPLWQGLSKPLYCSGSWVIDSWTFPKSAKGEAELSLLMDDARLDAGVSVLTELDIEKAERSVLEAWKQGIDVGLRASTFDDDLEALVHHLPNLP